VSVSDRWKALQAWAQTPLVKAHAAIAFAAFSIAWLLVAVVLLPDTGPAPIGVVPPVVGLRFDEGERSFVYAIDFSDLTDEMAALYEGADVWVADCLTRTPHPTHAHLDGVLNWARELKVGQVYLTHMGNGLDYRTLLGELPDWAAPAHDGLEIEL